MLDFAVNKFKSMGYKGIFLWVLEKNNKARRCYEKHGFCFDGTKREVTYGKLLVKLRYVPDLC